VKKNIRETFIVKGNITHTKQAIFLLHPHGIFSLTHAFHIGTDFTDWPYKNIRGVLHLFITTMPFMFDFMDEKKMVDSTYSHMKEALQKGDSMSMCLGNFTEGRYTHDTRITAIIKKRSGIFKMAIETGVPLIPVISYGEQSMFKQTNTFGFLEFISKKIGIQLNCPSYSCIKEWFSIYKKPLDKKVYTHIGDPIDVGEARTPTSKEIEELRNRYIVALQELYRATRPIDYEDEIVII